MESPLIIARPRVDLSYFDQIRQQVQQDSRVRDGNTDAEAVLYQALHVLSLESELGAGIPTRATVLVFANDALLQIRTRRMLQSADAARAEFLAFKNTVEKLDAQEIAFDLGARAAVSTLFASVTGFHAAIDTLQRAVEVPVIDDSTAVRLHKAVVSVHVQADVLARTARVMSKQIARQLKLLSRRTELPVSGAPKRLRDADPEESARNPINVFLAYTLSWFNIDESESQRGLYNMLRLITKLSVVVATCLASSAFSRLSVALTGIYQVSRMLPSVPSSWLEWLGKPVDTRPFGERTADPEWWRSWFQPTDMGPVITPIVAFSDNVRESLARISADSVNKIVALFPAMNAADTILASVTSSVAVYTILVCLASGCPTRTDSSGVPFYINVMFAGMYAVAGSSPTQGILYSTFLLTSRLCKEASNRLLGVTTPKTAAELAKLEKEREDARLLAQTSDATEQLKRSVDAQNETIRQLTEQMQIFRDIDRGLLQ